MNHFSRTWEKVLAWIGNVVLILATLVVSLAVYSGAMASVLESSEFRRAMMVSLSAELGSSTSSVELDNIISIVSGVFSAYPVFLIALTIIALIASFTMSKRILSGVLFLILALVTFIGTMGVLVISSLAYLIVAILLFVRKPKQDDFTNFDHPNSEVEKIEYI